MSIISIGEAALAALADIDRIAAARSRCRDTSPVDADIGAIAEHCPRIADILAEASALHGRASWSDYSRLRDQAAAHVGWSATDPCLASAAHYDVVIDALVEELGV